MFWFFLFFQFSLFVCHLVARADTDGWLGKGKAYKLTDRKHRTGAGSIVTLEQNAGAGVALLSAEGVGYLVACRGALIQSHLILLKFGS